MQACEKFYCCYLLCSQSPTHKDHCYIGFTVNPRRRLRYEYRPVICQTPKSTCHPTRRVRTHKFAQLKDFGRDTFWCVGLLFFSPDNIMERSKMVPKRLPRSDHGTRRHDTEISQIAPSFDSFFTGRCYYSFMVSHPRSQHCTLSGHGSTQQRQKT
jgi:hypothetical protein